MYERYFGFREAPFGVTPDPRFLYRNPRYEEALSTLIYGIQGRKGFVLLTGEVGTGKTTLLHALIAQLGTTPFVFVFNAVADFDQLLALLCDELGLVPQRIDRTARLSILNQFLTEQLRAGRTTALLIDEAQNLSPQTLEDLRLLSNLETPTEKLLQIVLVGQPELAARLAEPSLRQLRQRIALSCRLEPLSPQEVGDFIYHRLQSAGATDEGVIAPQAVARVARLSGGIPRLVNMICDNALLVCYAASQPWVTTEIVDEVAADLGLSGRSADPAPQPLDTAFREVEQFVAQREHPRRGRTRSSRLALVAVALLLLGGISAAFSPLRSESLIGGLHRFADDVLAAVPAARSLEPSKTAAATTLASRASDGAPTAASVVRDAAAITTAAHVDGGWPSRGLASLRVRVPTETSLVKIVGSAYGPYCRIALDLIPEANPEMRDPGVIGPGQTLWLPPIERATLLRRQPDGSSRLIVGAYFRRTLAARAARNLTKRLRLPIETTLRPISSGLSLYRIEVTDLRAPDDFARAWSAARSAGLLPAALAPFSKSPTRPDSCRDPDEHELAAAERQTSR